MTRLKRLTVFIFFISIKANSLSFHRAYKHRILMFDDCEEIHKNIESIRKWTENIGELRPALLSKILKVKKRENSLTTGQCQVDITDILPEKVKEIQGLNPQKHGPNCWNAALVLSKVLPNLRYTHNKEVFDIINSPLCSPVDANEKPRAGDLGIVRLPHEKSTNAATDEQYGFIFISDKLVFSKNGYKKQNPYSLQSTSKMLDLYASKYPH